MTALNLALTAQLSSGGTAARGDAGTAGSGEFASGDQFARLMQQQGHGAGDAGNAHTTTRSSAAARAGNRATMAGDRSRSTSTDAAADQARRAMTATMVAAGQAGAADSADPMAATTDDPAGADAAQAPADLAQWLAQLGMVMPGSVPPAATAGTSLRLNQAADATTVTVAGRGRTDGDARSAGGSDVLTLAGASQGGAGAGLSGTTGVGRDDGRAERWQEARGRFATAGLSAQAGSASAELSAGATATSAISVAGADRSGSGSEVSRVGAAGGTASDQAQALLAASHQAVPMPAASATGVAAAPGVEVKISTPVSDPGFGPVVMSRVGELAASGVQQAELHLNPAEMGPIVVNITIDQGQAQVDFQAAHAATRDLLEQSLSQLAQSLQDDGLTLGGSSVSSLPDQGDASSGGYGSSGSDGGWAGSWNGSGQGGQPSGRDDGTAGRWSAQSGRAAWQPDRGDAPLTAARPAIRGGGAGQLDLYA